jgi:type IV secretory pathway TrbF-like protein
MSSPEEAAPPQAALNPYLAARREWNERYGSYIAQAASWRRVALLALTVAAAAVGGLIYLGSQSKLVPYVVRVDGFGRAAALGPAERLTRPDARLITAALAAFINDAFSVIADGAAQKDAILRVYAHISTADPINAILNELYKSPAHNPFERAKSQTVAVAVSSVIPLTESTWEAEWTETVRDRAGALLATRPMKGVLTIALVPVTEERTILLNPLGLYVKNFNWSEHLRNPAR